MAPALFGVQVKTQAGSSALARESPETLIGWRVSVYWPGEAGAPGSDGWYTGQVTEFASPYMAGVEAESAGKHKVVYDDGSIEMLDLASEQVRPRPISPLR